MFKLKGNYGWAIHKHKARLVAEGFHQTISFDFTETFSSVVKPTTIRIILTVTPTKGWIVRQLDINNALLNGELKKKVFMQQPLGFEVPPSTNRVCKLHKAIYGLKQAPRAWFEKVHGAVLSFGFISAKFDQSHFIKVTHLHQIFFLVYVYDILITGSDHEGITTPFHNLNKAFALNDLGEMSYFCECKLQNNLMGIFIYHKGSIVLIFYPCQSVVCEVYEYSITSGPKLTTYASDPFQDTQLYRSIIGALYNHYTTRNYLLRK